MSDLLSILPELDIQVYKTNIALGYGQLAYFVHYQDETYLCIGLLNVEDSNSFAVGHLCKFAKHEIQHLDKSDFQLESSVLWNGDFIAWVIGILIPKLSEGINRPIG